VLHGRAAELGDIHELLADARAGHSSILVLQGEAGSDGQELYGETYLGMVGAALKPERKGSPPDVVAQKVQMVLAASRPRARYLVGKDAQKLANLVRFVPTSMLDALRRKIFHLPAPGSRMAMPIGEGASR
jgi:hypothetical protein